MVLPFISRMLMEEAIDDKFFYEHPDHPALLQAQQPFLDILSDDASSSSPSAARSGASGATHPSTSSSDAASDAAAANAPLTPAAVDSYAPFNGFDLDPAAFFSAGANSDLMSSAFLKGMEEANKFLPSQDKLVIDLDPPDDAKSFVLPAENKLAAAGFNGAAPVAAVAVKVEEAVVAAPDEVPGGGVGGRGRKNRFDDDEEDLEMDRRSSKQSALQGDGDDRDVFDKQHMITSQQMCVLVEQMEKLRIPSSPHRRRPPPRRRRPRAARPRPREEEAAASGGRWWTCARCSSTAPRPSPPTTAAAPPSCSSRSSGTPALTGTPCSDSPAASPRACRRGSPARAAAPARRR